MSAESVSSPTVAASPHHHHHGDHHQQRHAHSQHAPSSSATAQVHQQQPPPPPPPPLTSDTQPSAAPHLPQRLSVHDIRNSDLISRLLAATPSYLYSSPVGPQNFFFSDMLRSLVQSKHAEAANRGAAAAAAAGAAAAAAAAAATSSASSMQSTGQPSSMTAISTHPTTGLQTTASNRRPRKRTWGQVAAAAARGGPNHSLSSPTGHHPNMLFDIGPKLHHASMGLNNNHIVGGADSKPFYDTKPLELTNKCGGGGSSPMAGTALKYMPQPQHMMSSASTTSPSGSDKMLSSRQHGIKSLAESPEAKHDTSMLLNHNNNSIVPSAAGSPGNRDVGTEQLVLPPPPPMWYPPLYPPYGIDPLHFFIDLRVSGHIYDRKKENASPTTTTTASSGGGGGGESTGQMPPVADNGDMTDSQQSNRRHGSAFSVPQTRRQGDKSPTNTTRALNLSASPSPSSAVATGGAAEHCKHMQHSPLTVTPPPAASMAAASLYAAAVAHQHQHTTYDHTLMREAATAAAASAKGNSQYGLQNLPRIYTDLNDGRRSTNSDETTTDSKSDADAQEMRSLDVGRGGRTDEMLDDNGDDDDSSGDVVIVDNKPPTSGGY